VLEATLRDDFISALTRFVRGGECAHVVHAKDVANAAVYFNQMQLDEPECFFVSRDNDWLNSYSGLRKIYLSVLNNRSKHELRQGKNVPLLIPYTFRKLRLAKSNWGDVRYSSAKLARAGFQFKFDTKTAVSTILSINLGFATAGRVERSSLKKHAAIDTLVIIGASGFIGRNLVRMVAEKSAIHIRVMIQKEENKKLFQDIKNVSVFMGNLLAFNSLENILTPGCTVVNLAYIENETMANNLLAIKNLSDACKSKKIKRLVHCSTATVVGDINVYDIDEDTVSQAKSEYDLSKLRIEEYLVGSAMDFYELAILRPTSVFGAGSRNLVKLVDQLLNDGWYINYMRSSFSGKRRLNLVCLDNVLSAITFLCSCNIGADPETFIVSDDNNPHNNYLDIENILLEKLGLKSYPLPRIPIPGFLLALLLKLFRRPITQTQRYYNCTKLVNAGYEKTITIDAELNNFIEWYKKERSLATSS
jgi:nucleoside-diphosphate-sugar epimerase